MKLYRIRDWSDHYENNRTKELKSLSWVPIPIGHDGDGYTTLVDRENGASLFGAWIALVQVAGKCEPRGTLLRRAGLPHDPASLSRITRIPAKLFEEVLSVAESECNWLESEELQLDLKIPQEGAGLPHVDAPRARARTEQKGTEGNGIERNGSSANAPHSPDYQFKQRWCEEYQRITGQKYSFNGGKDGKAVKNLVGTGIPVDELITIAGKAWARLDLFNCRQAMSISGFYSRLNDIRGELLPPKPPPKQQKDIYGRPMYPGHPDYVE